MIAYTVIILIAWFGSIFVPFLWVANDYEGIDYETEREEGTHFLRG